MESPCRSHRKPLQRKVNLQRAAFTVAAENIGGIIIEAGHLAEALALHHEQASDAVGHSSIGRIDTTLSSRGLSLKPRRCPSSLSRAASRNVPAKSSPQIAISSFSISAFLSFSCHSSGSRL